MFLSLCCFVLTASFNIQQDAGYLPTSGRLTTQIPLDESQEYNLLKIASVACLCAVLENVTFKSILNIVLLIVQVMLQYVLLLRFIKMHIKLLL